ncbi:hypothetical protein FEM48_Zijuj01G0164900 [Ziziphus jujuba var. spinosa]|uniref:NB-ARC domain-containing protein n=1 Tax=Ziziphus jujuba var. spinosa TaxID=714518 RepID=A0A978W2B7_ZIZJJ|nr:hypothetical protein FEM48_Zijuj01G0164900 [Ziziphus jujuba var. spinosa]
MFAELVQYCGRERVLVKIAGYTVLPIRPHISYLIHYEKKAEHLATQVERLSDIKNGVELEVEAARRNFKTIAPDVERWLLHVHKTIQENDLTCGHEREANIRCCNGWCPNLKSRYSLGKRVNKMTLVVKKLLEDGNFQKVSYPATPPGIGFPSIQAVSELHEEGNSEGLEHRLPYTKEVLEALQDDKIKVIGILGMVRGEETVTEKEFMQRVKHLFEDVLMISITPNLNLEKIQGEIADMVGLKFENESLDERATILSARMAVDSKRFLVVLFDVCKRLISRQ